MLNVHLSSVSGKCEVTHDDSIEFDADFGFAGRTDYLPETPFAELDESDRLQALAEMHADQCIQSADDSHRNELAAAFTRAKQLAASLTVKIGRQIVIDSDGVTDSTWFAVIDHGSFGTGTSADAAVDDALARHQQSAA